MLISTPARRSARIQPRMKWQMVAFVACCLLCQSLVAREASDAAILRETYQRLIPELDHNRLHRRLYLDSQEWPSTVEGEIYAVMEHPFATVNDSLNDSSQGPLNWCDVLNLHPNIQYCHASSGSSGNTLTVNISRKEVAEELGATYRVRFNYDAVATSPEYFQVKLHADSGPLGTRNYRIVLEAAALSGNRTFLHLTYAYSYGVIGRLAMKAYLATFDRGKIGFTNIASPSAAQVEYVRGIRGLAERNTMRYYLAIEAYLDALPTPPARQLEQRLSNWFDASEQYPRQLHEIDRQEYMQMKREEYQRQLMEQ